MGDHKCFEASSSSKFASKGITLTGKCPASYNTVDKSVVVEQCPDGVTSIRYYSPMNVTIQTKGEAMMADALDGAGYTWDSCGTRLDRLKTAKLSVAGSLTAGSKVTVTASGTTDLHVPLETGAWQVRVYEDGEAHSIHSEVGDLMQALKFDDAKNTTFTVTVSFTLPAKQASGKFDANLVATDQAKSDYMCLDVKYAYAAEVADDFKTPVGKTIVDLAVATADLSTLVAALKAGGLVETLSGKGPFTVFAPTNEAFAKLPPATLAHLLKPANVK